MQEVYYNQYDPRWGDKPYSVTNDPTQTIKSSGCGPTCAAMVVATWSDKSMIPPTMCEYSVANGCRTPNDGTDGKLFDLIAKKYGYICKISYSVSEVIATLKNGSVVVAAMGRKSATERGYFTSSGHYIEIHGVSADGKYFYVNDPASVSRSKAPCDKSIFINEGKVFYILTKIPLEDRVINELYAEHELANTVKWHGAVTDKPAGGNDVVYLFCNLCNFSKDLLAKEMAATGNKPSKAFCALIAKTMSEAKGKSGISLLSSLDYWVEVMLGTRLASPEYLMRVLRNYTGI